MTLSLSTRNFSLSTALAVGSFDLHNCVRFILVCYNSINHEQICKLIFILFYQDKQTVAKIDETKRDRKKTNNQGKPSSILGSFLSVLQACAID